MSDVCPLPDGWLAYDVRGAGEPVLLLPSAAGAMGGWGAFREALARRLRVVSFDYRGCGGSSRARPLLRVEDVARDALALLERLGVGRAHVFGESFGGLVALRLAVDHPERVDHLLLASAAPSAWPPTFEGAIEALRLSACLLGPGMQRCLARRLSLFGRSDAEPSRVAVARFALAALRHDARRHLPRIAAPTLVLAGRADRLTPVRVERELARAIPGAELVVLDAGHAITADRPWEAARAVIEAVGRAGRKAS